MKKIIKILFAVLISTTFIVAQNAATVIDNGSFNDAFIKQIGSPNTATITQTGDLNTADQGDIYANTLFGLLTGAKGITQQGVGNIGTIIQTNLNPHHPVVSGPIAGIGQYSNYNKATILQSHSGHWMREYAWVQQQTGYNTSLQKQVSGNYHFSHIYQTGNTLNTAETQQWGGYNQRATIYQNGYDNDAYQFQGQTSLSYTEKNVAEATQLGNWNKSKQYQYGSDNTAKTVQDGNSNEATAYQYTSVNTSNVWQTGTGNIFYSDQRTGDGNTINLTQTNGSDANIYQNGAGNTVMGLGVDIMGRSLNGSTLDVDQINNGNTLHLNQTNGAGATVYQNGLTNTSVVIQN